MEVLRNGKKYEIGLLFHILHHSNLAGVLKNGLLSHNEAYRKGLVKQDISMADVQQIRANKVDGIHFRPLHDYVPFYFRSINPMLYKRKDKQEELLLLCVSPEIIKDENTIFTDGNAASAITNFYRGIENLQNIPLEVIFERRYWNDVPDGKRIVCAEVLVYLLVPREKIIGIICPNEAMRNYVLSLNDEPDIFKNEEVKKIKREHDIDTIAYRGHKLYVAINRSFFF